MTAAHDSAKPYYFVPQPSHWPITGSVALLLMGMGAAFWFNNFPAGPWMVLAGFIKHNFIALPLVALLSLWLDNWRLGLRATVIGAAASALGLAICAVMFAPHFIPDMLFPRTTHLARALSTLGRLQFILPAMVRFGYPPRFGAGGPGAGGF